MLPDIVCVSAIYLCVDPWLAIYYVPAIFGKGL